MQHSVTMQNVTSSGNSVSDEAYHGKKFFRLKNRITWNCQIYDKLVDFSRKPAACHRFLVYSEKILYDKKNYSIFYGKKKSAYDKKKRILDVIFLILLVPFIGDEDCMGR